MPSLSIASFVTIVECIIEGLQSKFKIMMLKDYDFKLLRKSFVLRKVCSQICKKGSQIRINYYFNLLLPPVKHFVLNFEFSFDKPLLLASCYHTGQTFM